MLNGDGTAVITHRRQKMESVINLVVLVREEGKHPALRTAGIQIL